MSTPQQQFYLQQQQILQQQQQHLNVQLQQQQQQQRVHASAPRSPVGIPIFPAQGGMQAQLPPPGGNYEHAAQSQGSGGIFQRAKQALQFGRRSVESGDVSTHNNNNSNHQTIERRRSGSSGAPISPIDQQGALHLGGVPLPQGQSTVPRKSSGGSFFGGFLGKSSPQSQQPSNQAFIPMANNGGQYVGAPGYMVNPNVIQAPRVAVIQTSLPTPVTMQIDSASPSSPQSNMLSSNSSPSSPTPPAAAASHRTVLFRRERGSGENQGNQKSGAALMYAVNNNPIMFTEEQLRAWNQQLHLYVQQQYGLPAAQQLQAQQQQQQQQQQQAQSHSPSSKSKSHSSGSSGSKERGPLKIFVPAFLKLEGHDIRMGRKIAEGGGGRVHECELLNSQFIEEKKLQGKNLVYKVVHKHGGGDKEAEAFWRDGFLQEISLMYAFRGHPNIIQVIGWTDTPDYGMVLQQYDMDLLTLVTKTNHKLPFWRLGLDIARALRDLHKHNITHNDIKSSNVFVEVATKENGMKSFKAVLADFGLSYSWGEESIKGRTKTFVFGLSIPYAGPELLMAQYSDGDAREKLAEKQFAARLDTYAYAVILWELMERHRAWGNMTSGQIEKAVTGGQRPNISANFQNHPAVNVIQSCWADNPNDRPGMDQVYSELSKLSQTPGASEYC